MRGKPPRIICAEVKNTSMDVSIETIMTIGGWLLGAGGAGGLLTWRLSRRKEKAEVQTAEVNMAQAVQDTYQQMLEDKDKEIQYYRADSSELRGRLDDMDKRFRDLQREVARNGRMVEAMRPFLCADLTCPHRQRVTISADGDSSPASAATPTTQQ